MKKQNIDFIQLDKLKLNDFVSMYYRPTKRHKWLVEYSFVFITKINEENNLITFQTSRTHHQYRAPNKTILEAGMHSCKLSEYRKLGKPILTKFK